MRFTSLLSLAFLAGCVGAGSGTLNLKDITETVSLSGESIALNSLQLTGLSSASFTINCGSSTHFAVASTIPGVDSSDWQACSTGNFSYSHALSDGLQTLTFWLKLKTSVYLFNSYSLRKSSGLFFYLS